MAAHPTGNGYWLVASDGGIFTFGTATFHGSAAGGTDPRPAVGVAATPSGDGYWIARAAGGARLAPWDGLVSDQRRMAVVGTIGGAISPKSVVHSGDGLFFAQNMMYRHTVTVYDRDLNLVATIPDRVVVSDFGTTGVVPGASYQGAPVEADFTSDGSFAYVSNYKMYGPGLGTAGYDSCGAGSWAGSFLYRIDTSSLTIDQVIPVGAVPKFVAVTPDDARVLVTNWCGFDLSVVDTASAAEVARVPVGRHPRGIAVSPDSTTAYVAVMGSRDIAVIDLTDLAAPVGWLANVGASPRHLVLSPDGGILYATLNGEGRVVKIDLATGTVVAGVATGQAPRSMAMADDGASLYVVNYFSNSVSKVRTSDMVELQELGTGTHPIGITYDADSRRVWVSNYQGSIQVFEDRAP
ncbi:MAG: YncE family protein [Actinomycetia bacterium]|nr:YncE family protein [Actinomycetes bacterium]